ncbi:unnamed protein product [Choristocarpus tenellus]
METRAVKECLLLLRKHAGATKEGDEHEVGRNIDSVPRTNEGFQSCQLRLLLYQELIDALGGDVDDLVVSGELENKVGGCVYPSKMNEAVTRLVSSSKFDAVTEAARGMILRSLESEAAQDGKGGRESENEAALGDLEYQHPTKTSRNNEWGGIFNLESLCGGRFGPAVDVGAVLGKLEEGLSRSTGTLIETLGTLEKTEPQDIQFSGHWAMFLTLVGRTLESEDADVHAKGLTVHWTMYEKAEGMLAADLCENILGHAKRHMESNVHVVSFVPNPNGVAAIDRNLVHIIGDCFLASIARTSKTLHGMLATIHKAFPHLPDARVSSMMENCLALFACPRIPVIEGGSPGMNDVPTGQSILAERRSGQSWCIDAEAEMILPVHFLALLDSTAVWLTEWLRTIPTARVMHAVNSCNIIEDMLRRCKQQRCICDSSRLNLQPCTLTQSPSPHPPPQLPSVSLPSSMPLGNALKPTVTTAYCVHHLKVITRVAEVDLIEHLSLGELDQALLHHSVSFLGRLVTSCRGAMWPIFTTPPNPTTSSHPQEMDPMDIEGMEGSCRRGLRKEPENQGGQSSGTNTSDQTGEKVLWVLVHCTIVRGGTVDINTLDDIVKEESLEGQRPWHPPHHTLQALALEHVKNIARASAGAFSTPFTLSMVDNLLLPLHCVGDGRNYIYLRDIPSTPQSLRAVADIATILLSSRTASSLFLQPMYPGPEDDTVEAKTARGDWMASKGLVAMARAATSLARHACSSNASRLTTPGSGGKNGEQGRHPVFSFLTPNMAGDLALRLVCALTPLHRLPPSHRYAARLALWRQGVPGSLSPLLGMLSSDGPCEEESVQELCNSHELGILDIDTRIGCRGLLLALCEWAQDIHGTVLLRQHGLIGPCARFLSQEIERRHLRPINQEESPDYGMFAIASQLALFPEGLQELCKYTSESTGGLIKEILQGFQRLGDSGGLPELMQEGCYSGLVPAGDGGIFSRMGWEGKAGQSSGLSQQGEPRCLSCARHLMFAAASLRDMISLPFKVCRGLEWLTSWVVGGMILGLDQGKTEDGKEDAEQGSFRSDKGEPNPVLGFSNEDMHLIGLRLAADMATDLTTVVGLQTEWSLSQKLLEGEGILGTDLVLSMGPAHMSATAGGYETNSISSTSTHCNDRGDSNHVTRMPAGDHCMVHPISLARSRLVVALTCMGGPAEEQHVRLSQLLQAEACAGVSTQARVGGERHKKNSGTGPGTSETLGSTPMAPLYQEDPTVEAFVASAGRNVPNEDWWTPAGETIRHIIASPVRSRDNTSPLHCEVPSRTSGAHWKVVCASAARDWPHLPSQRRRIHRWTEAGWEGGRGEGANDLPLPLLSPHSEGSLWASMIDLIYGYACSFSKDTRQKQTCSIDWGLNFNNFDVNENFRQGLGEVLATAAALTMPPGGGAHSCDWFAAAIFLACGGDPVMASMLLSDLSGRSQAPFVWPLAGWLGTRRAVKSEVIASAAPTSTNTVAPELPQGSDKVVLARLEAALGDPPLLVLASLTEDIVMEELPLLSEALRQAGWAVAPLAMRWISQCMLGVVDLPDVIAYLALAMLRGPDYQVYFVTALLQTAQARVLTSVSSGVKDLTDLLGRGQAFENFDLPSVLDYVEGLEARHREMCLSQMRQYMEGY